MLAGRRRLVAALALALVGLSGCSRERGSPRASEDDPSLQLRISEGERLLERIRARRGSGREVLADCRLAHALFARPLARLKRARARRVARELTRVCRDAREHPSLR